MKKIYKLPLLATFVLGIMILASGCQVNVYEDPAPNPCNGGAYGRDGLSFIALDYSNVEPDYIWGDNPALPDYFAYGSFYQSGTGTYQLYYEGQFYDGCCLADYYWDVDYDLWYHPGTAGGPCGQVGQDGADSFLTLWMDPMGPGVDRINKMSDSNFQVLEKTDTKIVLQETKGDYTLKVTYTKLEESKKDKLDPKGLIKG